MLPSSSLHNYGVPFGTSVGIDNLEVDVAGVIGRYSACPAEMALKYGLSGAHRKLGAEDILNQSLIDLR